MSDMAIFRPSSLPDYSPAVVRRANTKPGRRPFKGSRACANVHHPRGTHVERMERRVAGGAPNGFAILPYSGNRIGVDSPHWQRLCCSFSPGFRAQDTISCDRRTRP
jgi:hypothetical protein